ncbi:CFI-box-CTERM domain-containing protein [Halodesulfovibrio sp.]|uniref:PulJ/GspJ family protein n=1 Tax=Halodesulfovibrio sp. TaxID=1912772 RepID=UPI0025C64B25|nr:CFI-box-CTERM domain-containing protein [Halodesulfovibrio sp.]
MHKPYGFTLLELVTTLALVGILSTVGGAGFISATKGYLFTKEISGNTQSGQATMARLGKMLRNLTNISKTGKNAFKVTYLRSDESISEQISLVKNPRTGIGILQTVHSGSNNLRIPAGTYPIQKNITDFVVQYHSTDTEGWQDSPPASGLHKLMLIRIQLKMDVAGTPLEFATTFIPRNVFYAPEQFDSNGLYKGFGSSPNCFIATATYGSPNSPVVLLLRQFRDRYLATWSGGRKVIECYYEYSPAVAKIIRENRVLLVVSRIVLLPLAGFACIALFFPYGLLCIPLLCILGKNLAKNGVLKTQRRESGGVLLGIIAAMLFMSLLSTAMLNMYGSSVLGTVSYSLSPKAYYLAESGIRYAGKVYLEELANDNGEPSNAVRNLHNKTFVLPDKKDGVSPTDQTIHLDIATYWFEAPSSGGKFSKLSFYGNMLGEIPPNLGTNAPGYLYLASSRIIVPFSGVSQSSDGLIFTLTNEVTVQRGEDILFAGRATKKAARLSVGGNLSIGSAVSLFPPSNGVVLVNNGKQEQYAMYAKANYASGTLEGLSEVPGQTQFLASFPITAFKTDVILQHHAIITSTGSIGALNEPMTRTITQSQPLMVVSRLVRKTFTETFDNPEESASRWNTITGKEKSIENQKSANEADNNALAATGGTVAFEGLGSQSTSVESLTGLDSENQSVKDMLKMHDTWGSGESLQIYDMQVKIKFDQNDDVIHTTLNGIPIPEPDYTYGSWLFGFRFHVRENESLTTMFGVSFVNTYRGREYNNSLRGDADWDGIYDDLQDNHGNNKISDSDTQFWNDTPIVSGVPYLIFWEQSFAGSDFSASGITLSTAQLLSKYPLAGISTAAFALYKRITDNPLDGPTYIMHVYPTATDALAAYEDGYIFNGNVTGIQSTDYEFSNPEIYWNTTNNLLLSYRDSNNILLTAQSVNYRPAFAVPYVGYALSPKYNVLNRTAVGNNWWILGTPNTGAYATDSNGNFSSEHQGYVFKSPATPSDFFQGLPQWLQTLFSAVPSLVTPVESAERLSAKHSYRFWIQDWTTLQASVTEFNAIKTDLPYLLGANKVVVTSASFATPNGNSTATGDVKVIGRTAYPRFAQGSASFLWPDDGDAFLLALWESRKGNSSSNIWQQNDRFENYSSQLLESGAAVAQLAGISSSKKIVFPATDSEYDYIFALAGSFIPSNDAPTPITSPLNGFLLGLHSMGIGDFGDGKTENVYFDDFALRLYERTPEGFLPGVQQEE